MDQQGASVVINHRVLEGKDQEYEQWLSEIAPISHSAPGIIDWQIVRPIKGLTHTYTIMLRFDSVNNLKNWMESPERKRMIEKAQPLLVEGDKYEIKTGLDFLFSPPPEAPKAPVRWKQFLVTWSAIFPLTFLIPLVIVPLLRWLHIPQIRLIDTFVISGIVVFLMVYVVMPRYTKLIKKWLYS